VGALPGPLERRAAALARDDAESVHLRLAGLRTGDAALELDVDPVALARRVELIRTGGFVRGAFVPGAARELDDAIAAAKRSLPPERFAAAWSAGQALSLEEAVREA
jgi:hypothetical protein